MKDFIAALIIKKKITSQLFTCVCLGECSFLLSDHNLLKIVRSCTESNVLWIEEVRIVSVVIDVIGRTNRIDEAG